MNENTSLIVISQLPVIEDQLKALQDKWEQKAKDAAAMICTEDTVQDLKTIRAETTKEFKEADALRKDVKAQYMAPWDAVEATFKECVKDAYTRADATLKDQIDSYQNELKAQCEANLRTYYAELIEAENIDFLSFEDAMKLGRITISMTDAKRSTPRKLQDDLAAVVSKVAVSVEQIMKMDDAPAIMAEFKQCFDVGKAVSVVQERKRREAEEKAAAEARKAAQETQAAAVEKVDAVLPAKPVQAPVAAPAKQKKNPDDVFPQFTFTIYGATRAQLIRVRDFLKQEGLNYG